MKTLKQFFIALIMIGGFASCEDDSIKAVLKTDVVPNVLQAPTASAFVLTLANKDQNFATFSWTAPDFGFKSAVTYTLEADLAGNNFANAIELATTSSLSAALNVGATNDLLLGLGLVPETPTEVQLRVTSFLDDDVEPVVSNAITVTLTAYATSFPPIWGRGAALKGWGSSWPGEEVEWQSTEFRKYETIAYFTSGETFRWFAQLDWNPVSYNYPYFTTVSSVFENANDNDSNLRVAGSTGWYRVGVDLTAKTVTAVAVDEPVLYVTGSITGWNQPGTGASVKMTYIKPGVFQADVPLVSDGTFRFFAQANWNPTSYNFPYFTSVPQDFENANDDDSNFRYTGSTGTKKITVDLNEKTVTVGDPPLPVLYITGDDFGWDWNDDDDPGYEQMTYNAGSGTFTFTAELTNNALFRFFPQKGWSSSYGYNYFTTIDSELGDQGPGDHNFRYLGTTGSRTITVNLTAKTVTLD